MKRKIYSQKNAQVTMEELNVPALTRRKESAAPLTEERDACICRHSLAYPVALVLRLRVLQIVCGISTMVMGSVAFIEERQKFNMGLGIPAGAMSILAAAVSIHTSKALATVPGGATGGSVAVALWIAATAFMVCLMVQCCRTIINPVDNADLSFEQEDTSASPRDLLVIACVQTALAIATLLSAAFCSRIERGAQ